jgi:hypothetical protein
MALHARHEEAMKHFPGWEVRLYLDARFTEGFGSVLAAQGYNVIRVPASKPEHPQWYRMGQRLRVLDDPLVDVFLQRDLDSALSPRDAISVSVWLTTAVPFLAMHDHPFHTALLMGGLWGGRRKSAQEIFPDKTALDLLDELLRNPDTSVGDDQDLLQQFVWPRIASSTLVFDSVQATCRHDGKLCNPFPIMPVTTENFLGGPGNSLVSSEVMLPSDCADLARKLEGIRVLDQDDLNAQWTDVAWPHIRGACLK